MLHEALAEGAAADDGAAVVVLDGSGEDLGCRCRALVNEHYDGHVLEGAAAVGGEVLALGVDTFGIDHELACRQELVDHDDGRLHVAATVAA